MQCDFQSCNALECSGGTICKGAFESYIISIYFATVTIVSVGYDAHALLPAQQHARAAQETYELDETKRTQ
jgi:hypothetical protein